MNVGDGANDSSLPAILKRSFCRRGFAPVLRLSLKKYYFFVIVSEWSIINTILMPARWTQKQESFYRQELCSLYAEQNKTILETALILGISEKTVFSRLKRLNIPTCRTQKARVNNKRPSVPLPRRSTELAETLGILLGDGNITQYQVKVTLGTKEYRYARYVQALLEKVFGIRPSHIAIKNKYHTVYFGSTRVTSWLKTKQGFVNHKVKSQVLVPAWIHSKKAYQKAFLRGFFDTDGSVYELRKGVQISFTNKSVPILQALQKMLEDLEYTPSRISANKVYLTRKRDIEKFFSEVKPQNKKHQSRYARCKGRWPSG